MRFFLHRGKHFHSWFLSQIFLFQRGTPQTTPFAFKFGGVQLEKYTKQKEAMGWVYMCYFSIFHGPACHHHGFGISAQ